MAMTRILNSREKAMLGLTVAVAVFLLVYYGFLSGFIGDYRSTTADIVSVEKDLEAQRKVLDQKTEINAQYDEIRESMLQGEQGKSPEAFFTEELAVFCGSNVGISPPQVEPVPEAPEFAFVVLNINGLQGNLERIVEILRGLYQRKLLVEELTIRLAGGARITANPGLELQAKVKKLVREKDLDQPDQARLKKMRVAAKPSRAAPAAGGPRVIPPEEP